MGVKLPAKLFVTEVNRITAATANFMFASIKGVECAQSEQSSSTSGSLRYMTVTTSWYVQLEHSKVRLS
jgi:hypothetical protein